MASGNPNPSPETRFQKGKSGNPGGKKKGQRSAEIEAAAIAANLRLKALSSLQEVIESGEMHPSMLIDANTLKLFKDSEDRAHGTPKQSTEITGDPEKPVGITAIERLIVKTPDPDA